MRLFQAITRMFQRAGKESGTSFDKVSSLENAIELKNNGDLHGTISALQIHLKEEPFDVVALTILGACQADVGSMDAARISFELAYSLDDSYIPAVANYARMLVDERKSADALPILGYAKVWDPNCLHIDAVYAAMVRNNGDAESAVHYYLRSWLANFDSLRFANGFLFNSGYCEVDGVRLAAEHLFWAETSVALTASNEVVYPLGSMEIHKAVRKVGQLDDKVKIRIGYWSPDFREHSVRYFFRPLLENHDRDQVEIFLYHDYPKEDAQTALMRSACDHFYSVFDLNEADLLALVQSQRLDVFVELAGHSSFNRALLLKQRFATVQVTALGYPPTMGLATIDAKLLDRHVITADSSSCYAEAPMVLPTSFWCFDPMKDAPIDPAPPSTRNGNLTFACVGNVAKITDEVLQCWKHILERVPNSRLLIRSVSFEDSASENMIRERLVRAGIAMSLVDLCKPELGKAFLDSYNEIDIILDTFPFNGGTTTCFATYMGVPVVSRAGNSLISRMGLSILTNLGVPELVVHDAKAYTECAVGLANNTAFLRQFRRDARKRFQATALGDGKLFAREFEDACRELLEQKKAGTFSYQHTIPPLPAEEIVRRAYAVLRYGQTEAAQRIVQHCLHHYPNFGSAHLLVTQMWTSEDRFAKAVEYLLARLSSFTEPEQVSVLIHVTRLYLLLEDAGQAEKTLARLATMSVDDDFDRLQVQLFHTSLVAAVPAGQPAKNVARTHSFSILMPCDSDEAFESMRKEISENCFCPEGWLVNYQQCEEEDKIVAYKTALRTEDADVLIFLQKNIALHNPMFLVDVAEALEGCDVLGFSGATRWSRMEWRVDEFERKAAGFFVESSEKPGFIEIQVLGISSGPIVNNLAVLDGGLLAMVPSRVRTVEFDEDLFGAELLLEEDWSHSAFRSGLRLAVHRNLGVLINPKSAIDNSKRALGRVRCAEKLGWDPFAIVKDDYMTLSLTVETSEHALAVCRAFMTETSSRHHE